MGIGDEIIKALAALGENGGGAEPVLPPGLFPKDNPPVKVGSTVKLSPALAKARAEQLVQDAYATTGELPSTAPGSFYSTAVEAATKDLQAGIDPSQVAAVINRGIVGARPPASISRLGSSGQAATPGGTNDLPEGTVTLPNGAGWLIPNGAGGFNHVAMPQTSQGPRGPSAAEEAASLAQAAYYEAGALREKAQAGDIDAQKMLREQMGKPVQGAEGYVWNAAGVPVDVGAAGRDVTRLGIDQQRANSEGDRVGIEGQRLASDTAYQQGQLGIAAQRLGLDTRSEAAKARAEAQRNELDKNKYIAEILRNPADYVASAFRLSGQQSPVQQITQADLINKINMDFGQLQPGQSLTPPQLGTNPPQLGNGGMVRDRQMIVGDPQQGDQANPEMVYNPTGAPISVMPMNRMSQYAEGTATPDKPVMDPMMAEMQAKVKGISRLLQHVENADTQHMLVDELAQARGRLKSPVPAYSYGTGEIGSPGWIQSLLNAGFTQTGTTATTPPPAPQPGEQSGYSGGYYNRSDPTYTPSRLADPAGYQEKLPPPPYPPPQAPALPALTQPQVKAVNQQDIIASAEAQLSNRVRALFGTDFGKNLATDNFTPNPRQPLGITPARFPFALFSPQQLSMMTQKELLQLNTYLVNKYDTTLQEVLDVQQQVYNPSIGRRRGRLVR